MQFCVQIMPHATENKSIFRSNIFESDSGKLPSLLHRNYIKKIQKMSYILIMPYFYLK